MNSDVETVVAVLDTAPVEVETDLSKEVTAIEVVAESLVVTNEVEYEQAGNLGRLLREKMAEVTEFFAPIKKSAHEAHKQICDREKAMLKPLKNAESILKRAVGEYCMKQEEARRSAEEEARRRALEEAERKLQESIDAEANGDVEKAMSAFKDAELADKASKSIVIDVSKPQATGVSTSIDWEIESIDESKAPVEVNGTVIRPVDTTAVMKLIRASKGTIEIEGIKYKAVVKTSFRR